MTIIARLAFLYTILTLFAAPAEAQSYSRDYNWSDSGYQHLRRHSYRNRDMYRKPDISAGQGMMLGGGCVWVLCFGAEIGMGANSALSPGQESIFSAAGSVGFLVFLVGGCISMGHGIGYPRGFYGRLRPVSAPNAVGIAYNF